MIIGIDLGTTNSLGCAWIDGKTALIPNAFGKYLTPSIVSVEGDSVIVGEIAKQRLVTHPSLTIASFKRFMGTNKKVTLGDFKFTAQELSSFIIKQIIEDAEKFLNEKVEEAIISVPAYFNNVQRNATKAAGKLAGIKVERIINEPTAAILSMNESFKDDKNVLVFDFGGGTLDVSIVNCFNNILEVISISGDNHLGGDDFDEFLLERFSSDNKKQLFSLTEEDKESILSQLKIVKENITTENMDYIVICDNKKYSFTMNNEKFVSTCISIFQKLKTPIQKALDNAQMDNSEIDEILMIGGSSKLTSVQNYIEYIMNKKPIVHEECDLSVGLGCGVMAGIKMRKDEIKDIVVTDVCPFSLGISTHNESDVKNSYYFIIIDRNSILPSSKVNRFYTVSDNQIDILVEIYQGEEIYAKNNILLGELTCRVPRKKAGEESIDVRFSYDINGILEVDVEVVSTGKKYKKSIIDKSANLTEEQINEKIKTLKKLKHHPKDDVKNKLLIARGEKLFKECIGNEKEIIKQSVNYFNLLLDKQEENFIRRKYNLISKLFDSIENRYDHMSMGEEEDVQEFLEFLKDSKGKLLS